jgi:hypothetical protein
MRDKVEKGRSYHPIGERNRQAKLTEARVRELYEAQGTQLELSEKFGVCQSRISMIKNGRSWKHLTKGEPMSREICINFEIRNMIIMKDTLKNMGINYTDLNDHQVQIKAQYRPIVIDSDAGNIKFDDMSKKVVDSIKQTYALNWHKDQAIREGNVYREEKLANGQIILHVSHS